MDEISREQCELAEKLNAKNAPAQLLRELSEEGREWKREVREADSGTRLGELMMDRRQIHVPDKYRGNWDGIVVEVLQDLLCESVEDEACGVDVAEEVKSVCDLLLQTSKAASNIGVLTGLIHLGEICGGAFSEVCMEEEVGKDDLARGEGQDYPVDYTTIAPEAADREVAVISANTILVGATGAGKSVVIRFVRDALGEGPSEEDDEPESSHSTSSAGGKDSASSSGDGWGLEWARGIVVAGMLDTATFAGMRGVLEKAISKAGESFPLRRGVHLAVDEAKTLLKECSGQGDEKCRDTFLNGVEGLAVKVSYGKCPGLHGKLTMTALLGAQPCLVEEYGRNLFQSGFFGKHLVMPVPPACHWEDETPEGGMTKALADAKTTFEAVFHRGTKIREEAKLCGDTDEVVVSKEASRYYHRYAREKWPQAVQNDLAIVSPVIATYVARRLRFAVGNAVGLSISLRAATGDGVGVRARGAQGRVVVTKRHMVATLRLVEYSIISFATLVWPRADWTAVLGEGGVADITATVRRVSALARERSRARCMAAAYSPQPRMAGMGSARRQKALEVLEKLITSGSRAGGTILPSEGKCFEVRKLASWLHRPVAEVRAALHELKSAGLGVAAEGHWKKAKYFVVTPPNHVSSFVEEIGAKFRASEDLMKKARSWLAVEGWSRRGDAASPSSPVVF